MSSEQRFGEADHEALGPDDVLTQAIGRLPDAAPVRDLWPDVAARLVDRPRWRVSATWGQLAMAASLLIAVTAALTWLVARQPAVSPATEMAVRAEGETAVAAEGRIAPANFADVQYDAAVLDLERILRDDRARLDPRTVMVIERNLRTIDDAIGQARRALDADPANPYLNSHLADTRRRKLNLLRRATELASMGGN